jgi:very-short-patch-repair endonuclease
MTIARARQLRKEMPYPEAMMWNALRTLRPLGFHFRRQAPLGPYYADFACHHPRFVIEIDGLSHTNARYDADRDAFMRKKGYRVLRVSNDDVLRELVGVMRLVQHELGIGP